MDWTTISAFFARWSTSRISSFSRSSLSRLSVMSTAMLTTSRRPDESPPTGADRNAQMRLFPSAVRITYSPSSTGRSSA